MRCLYCSVHEGSKLPCSNEGTGHRFTVRDDSLCTGLNPPLSSEATGQQPAPVAGEGDMWKDVIADMEARREFGIKKYGKPVQVGNGRDALTDAYQEVLDLAVYLKQAIKERDKADNGVTRRLTKVMERMNKEIEETQLEEVKQRCLVVIGALGWILGGKHDEYLDSAKVPK